MICIHISIIRSHLIVFFDFREVTELNFVRPLEITTSDFTVEVVVSFKSAIS